MPSVSYSVVIVNYNGGDYLQKAVDSLAAQTNQDFELIVIDNASSDESMKQLDTGALSKCRIVMNTENLGFSVANNMAAKLASGRWLVLLNPDAAADPEWIEKLDRATQLYQDCRVFTSAQYDMHNLDIMDGAGDAYLVFGIPWRGGYGQSIANLPETGHCFSACGAGAVYDRQLFLSLGGFDERFFCYCEDVDLGFRLQLIGETCIFVRDAVIHHAGSAISGEGSPFSTYHGTRNRIWTYFKNMPRPLLILTLPAHLVITVYLLLRSILKRRFKATVLGTWHGVRDLPEIMDEPRWRVKSRSVSLWALARAMAWNPILMSRRGTHVRLNVPSQNKGLIAVNQSG